MDAFARMTYRGLLALACVSMVAALTAITLNIATRLVDGWSITGLDGYAGYSIAAAFFLALPAALIQGDHIRVTVLLQNVSPRVRDLAGVLGAGHRLGNCQLSGLVFLSPGVVFAPVPRRGAHR